MHECQWCGEQFTPKRPERNRFCSRSCVSKSVQAVKRAAASAPVLNAVCECGCGEAMPEFDAHGRRRRYLYRHNPKTRAPRVCTTCGEQFQHRGAVDFCSRQCSSRSRVVTKVDLTCLTCGEDYPVYPYRAESSKYCSKDCWSRRAPIGACLHCGQEFTAYSNQRKKYCSRACAHKHMVGDRSAAWKDGASLRNDRARHSNQLRVWRLAVYRRDGYRCRDCGGKGHLHAHHVKYWSTHPELRFDVDNGKTLCIDCHGQVHGRNFRPKGRSKTDRHHV